MNSYLNDCINCGKSGVNENRILCLQCSTKDNMEKYAEDIEFNKNIRKHLHGIRYPTSKFEEYEDVIKVVVCVLLWIILYLLIK